MSREARDEARPDDREEKGRRKRIPLGAPELRLEAETRKGFVRRWINDTPGRLARAEQAGYSPVLNRQGEPEARLVGTHEHGAPMYAHLMEQREQYYAEDQARKEEQNARVDEAINRGKTAPNVQVGPGDAGKFYGEGSTSRS